MKHITIEYSLWGFVDGCMRVLVLVNVNQNKCLTWRIRMLINLMLTEVNFPSSLPPPSTTFLHSMGTPPSTTPTSLLFSSLELPPHSPFCSHRTFLPTLPHTFDIPESMCHCLHTQAMIPKRPLH